MKIENTFNIKIADQEVQCIVTVGDFHDAVWRHLSNRNNGQCHSRSLFYKLRRSFSETFGFPVKQLSIGSSPDEIFPKANRRYLYKNFSEITGLKLPELILSRPLEILLEVFGFATIIGSLALSLILVNVFDYSKWLFLAPLPGILLTFLLSELLNPQRTSIRETTIKDFTYRVLALNYSTLATAAGASRPEMELVVNHIISDMAGLDLEDVTTHKKIADDLGID